MAGEEKGRDGGHCEQEATIRGHETDHLDGYPSRGSRSSGSASDGIPVPAAPEGSPWKTGYRAPKMEDRDPSPRLLLARSRLLRGTPAEDKHGLLGTKARTKPKT